ncbi:hypothetical protein Bbelb_330740 [Branchiostoma belcheri]|nr:hypothetical protein Bbelb_330740 [Branchiostoma belcheri]
MYRRRREMGFLQQNRYTNISDADLDQMMTRILARDPNCGRSMALGALRREGVTVAERRVSESLRRVGGARVGARFPIPVPRRPYRAVCPASRSQPAVPVCYVFLKRLGRSGVNARHSHRFARCKSVVCTPRLAVSDCVHRFRTEAVLTTHGCPTFAHMFARRQHTEARWVWHIDSNHKLNGHPRGISRHAVRWGISIQAGIDGYSRTCTFISAAGLNTADQMMRSFLQGVREYGFPSRIRTDRGNQHSTRGMETNL